MLRPLFTAPPLLALGFLFFVLAPTQAEPVTYSFSGVGIHGSLAAGTFTVDSVMTVPGYVGDSTIFTQFSLTITNIPQGTGSMMLGREQDGGSYESGTNYFVDNSGTILIAPAGDYYPTGPGPGAQRTYQLTVENPGPGSSSNPLIGDILLGGNLVDQITWSPAAIVEAVPEPGAWYTAALAGAAVVVMAATRGRRRVRQPRLDLIGQVSDEIG